ncbi:MAG: thiamine pyrophosphate-binding protein [Candidatus Omnitrophica bacterium]|jgi:acetolactate synthase-1/2/3 large subunit|nr:thiamine pyrophosphate-binding protein [Candidatus Omnitrophota bacterium]
MRVADYIFKFLESKGIKYAHEVVGGGAMYLNDVVSKSSITPIFHHHEQAAAMAAVGYSKYTNEPGLVVCTSGCGSTNVITGLLDAWQDSNKLIVISGQANKKEISHFGQRKNGIQEVNICEIVKSITKYVVTISNPLSIAYDLEKAYYLCTTGRPGPVWIDVPLDVQHVEIDEEQLEHYTPPPGILPNPNSIKIVEDYLSKSTRPIIIAGYGIHLSNSKQEFKNFIEHYQIPVATTILGTDFLEEDHPLYVGRIGLKGTRAGNFAVANSDLIIGLGTSMHLSNIGFDASLFGRKAKIITVDVDVIQSAVHIDKQIVCDLKSFFKFPYTLNYNAPIDWIKKCQHWKNKWNIFDRVDINELNLYSFTKKLSEITKDIDSTVITDAGSTNYVLTQALSNNKLIFPASQGEMGFAIPAAIGVALADKKTKTIVVVGEGSFQFNIQELQTIVQYNLPIKIFVINNGGYLTIKNTQTKFFNKNYTGMNEATGVSFPELNHISYAYNIPSFTITDHNDLNFNLSCFINSGVGFICEVLTPNDEQIYPTNASLQKEDGTIVAQPLENMHPFLSKEEYEQEMIIPIYLK